jgi:diadenosine tetraphosphate (Ap4A) HIT family hydrolase
MNCPFCDESIGESQTQITQSEHAVVRISKPRLMKGHLLVIPKRHVEYPGDLKDQELLDIFKLIEIMRSKLLDTKLADGVDIRQNYRPFLEQDRLKVDHLHFHVMPRHNEDELYEKSMKYEKGIFIDVSSNEEKEVLKLLNIT